MIEFFLFCGIELHRKTIEKYSLKIVQIKIGVG